MSTGNELVTLKQVDNYYKDLRKRSAPVIFNNAIGNPAVFSDGADGLPIQSLKVHLLPRQEGTGDPSPENIRSIVPWNGLMVFGGGENLLDEKSVPAANRYIKYTSPTNAQWNASQDSRSYKLEVEPNTTYTIRALNPAIATFRVCALENGDLQEYSTNAFQWNGTGERVCTITTSETEHYLIIQANKSVLIDRKGYIFVGKGTAEENPVTATAIVFPAMGKNLLPDSAVEYGSYNTTGEKIQDGNNKYRCLSVNLPTGNYTFSTDTENCIIIRLLVDDVVVGSGGKAQSKSFTLSNPANVKIAWRNDTTTEITGTLHNQIETGSTPTEYEPFDNTVYGGVVDITNGKLTVEYGIVDLNSIAFYAVRAGFFAAYANLPEYADRTKFACNAYKVVSYTYWDDMEDLTIMGITPGNVIRIRDDSLADVPALQAKLTELDAKLVYPLVEPYEVQLTPTQFQSLYGSNTIWSDANGDIEVEYRADTEKFVEKSIANLPIATKTKLGVIKVPGTTGLYVVESSGVIATDKASLTGIKAGTSVYNPVVPELQHASTFYGLAKAAGADMAQSSNPIGTYADPAKTAIQKMLGFDGIFGNYELSTTASKAYAIGETFIFNGNRYRATSAIAINGVLVPGTNCELDPIDGHYVRDTDYALSDGSTAGVVIIPAGGGKGIDINSNHELRTRAASSYDIKQGIGSYAPLTPHLMHEAAYYALSKLAGVDLKSETVTVGTYPQTSKTAIQTMLGIEADIPLVETVTGATASITGMPNVRYICDTAISELTITPPASGSIVVRFTAGSNCIVSLPQTVKLPEWFDISSLEAGTTYELIITDGVYGGVMSWAA